MPGMTHAELEEMVCNEYARLRAAWFPAERPACHHPEHHWPICQQAADLVFAWDDASANCGYIYRDNRLIIAAEVGWLYMGKDLMDGEPPIAVYTTNAHGAFTWDWSPWRVFLLHEMCHEYQFKVLLNHDQTPVGREMFHRVYCERDQPVKWGPTGLHPTPFLAAIASLADHLGGDRIALHDRL